MQPQKILLPTDFSEASKPALRAGITLCRKFDAVAHFVHVVRLSPTPVMMPYDAHASWTEKGQPDLAALKSQLETLVDELAGRDEPLRREVEIESGSYVPTTLLEYSHRHRIDAIVMGTHGRRGFRRFLLGSVAEEMVRKARCPVLTVGAESSGRFEEPLRVLGAVDLQEGTDEVMDAIAGLRKSFECEVELIHVIQPIYPAAYGNYGVPITIDLEGLELEARGVLAERLAAGKLDETASQIAVSHGDPDVQIVEFAKEKQMDLVVVATHARVGLPHVLLGSVADRVVRTAHCPVLTVLGKERDAHEDSGG